MQKLRLHLGFTLVEVLMSLAISALLLVGLAIAFNAAAVNYQENQATAEAVNTARQALVRMTTQLRTGSGIVISESNSKCTFNTAGGLSIGYKYDSNENKLYLESNGSDKTLCQNVMSMDFTGALAADPNDYKSIQISMTVQSGDATYPLSAAVVIRRNLEI